MPTKTKLVKKKLPKVNKNKISSRVALPSIISLFKTTFSRLKHNSRLLSKLLLIYVILLVLFVWLGGGLTNADQAKQTVNKALNTSGNSIITNVTVFSMLVGSGNGNELKSLYQTIIVIIMALAFIWTFRHTKSDKAVKNIKAKDPFYLGMTPLIPFLLVLSFVGLQLLPLLMGSVVIGIVFGNGLAATGLEQAVWIALFLATLALAVYWLASSLFALVIVTLPNSSPLYSLRAAKKLVKGRRLDIIKKLLGALFVVLVLVVVSVMGAIYIAPFLAQTLLMIFSILLLPVIIAYIFTLYQELL